MYHWKVIKKRKYVFFRVVVKYKLPFVNRFKIYDTTIIIVTIGTNRFSKINERLYFLDYMIKSIVRTF